MTNKATTYGTSQFVTANGHWTRLSWQKLRSGTVTGSSMTSAFSGQQLLVVVDGQARQKATLRGTGHVVANWAKADHQANPIGHSQLSVNSVTPACSSVTHTIWTLLVCAG